MDKALENKICDLYDLYIVVIYQIFLVVGVFLLVDLYFLLAIAFYPQRIGEDPEPPARRLFEEVTT